MRREWAVILISLGVILSGCGSGSVPGGWARHQDEIGYTVHHPKNWSVTTHDSRWVEVRDNSSSAFAVIFPFLAPQATTAERCVRNVPGLLGDAFPVARVVEVKRQNTQPDEVIATIGYSAKSASEEDQGLIEGFVSSLTERFGEASGNALALCSVVGRSGMFYAIGAPRESFEEQQETLVNILSNFSFTNPPKPEPQEPADKGISYVRWRDPNEQAFELEVPRGWAVEGGIFRGGFSVDVRFAMRLTSPDGEIRITAGDADIPPHVMPTSTGMLAGQLPGTLYDPGYGVPMLVMPFMSGKDYARHYANETVSRWCPGMRIENSRNRPDASRAINEIYQQSEALLLGIFQELSTGEVAFTCDINDGNYRGYYFAGTNFTGQMVGFEISGVWLVNYLYGYVARAEKTELAEAVIARMTRSLSMNQSWVRRQQQTTAAASGIVSQTSNEIAQIFDESYWSRQDVVADIYRNWSNTTLGLTDVRDEATGEEWKVASGHNYYWRQIGGDNVIGTDNTERPDIDFAPLLEF